MGDNPIIDSDITKQQALAQNPNKPKAPKEILDQQELLSVTYFSFDSKLHRGQIVIHRDLSNDIIDLFKLALDIKFPVAKVVPSAHPDYLWDPQKLVIRDNYTHGFTYRFSARTGKLSMHSKGRAIDINPMQNPFIRYQDDEQIIFPKDAKWDPSIKGTLHKDNEIVRFLESRGWEWGGHWTPETGRTDYMHLLKP